MKTLRQFPDLRVKELSRNSLLAVSAGSWPALLDLSPVEGEIGLHLSAVPQPPETA